MFSGVGDHFRQFWLDLKTSEESDHRIENKVSKFQLYIFSAV